MKYTRVVDRNPFADRQFQRVAGAGNREPAVPETIFHLVSVVADYARGRN